MFSLEAPLALAINKTLFRVPCKLVI